MQRKKSLVILRRKSGGYGGAELATQRFRHLFENDWDVTVLSAGNTIKAGRAEGEWGPGWWRAQRYSKSIDRLLDEYNPDIIFSLERGPDCHIYRAGDGVHLKYRHQRYGQGLGWASNPWHWLAPRLEAKSLASARVIVANSDMVRRDIEQYYPQHADKAQVIRNGYDPKRFGMPANDRNQIRQDLGIDSDGPMILFCGSGWKRKGLGEALRFTALAGERAGRAKPFLVVVGKGDSQAFKKEQNFRGLRDAVTWVAPVSDIAPFYHAADVLVMPTIYDPFSNACLEALACGCPVITTPFNGVAEVIHSGETGFVLGNNLDNMSEAVEFFIDAKVNRQQVSQSVCDLTLENENALYSKLFLKIPELIKKANDG